MAGKEDPVELRISLRPQRPKRATASGQPCTMRTPRTLKALVTPNTRSRDAWLGRHAYDTQA